MDDRALKLLRQFREKRYGSSAGPVSIVDPAEIVQNMRAIKDAHELELIRKATDISAEAHTTAMQAIEPGMYEYELQAVIEYTFLKSGADGPSYPTIAGAGANATCLHYDVNNCVIKDGDLVLVDAGAEYEHYAADITRTFPANGKFSDVQKELYSIVLNAQMAAIEAIEPGIVGVELGFELVTTLGIEGKGFAVVAQVCSETSKSDGSVGELYHSRHNEIELRLRE